ncbi:hypothetical protein I8U19_11875 [Thermoactinomyces sp. CICC 10523]|nr:hypothetical protein [Thermoactinomyces sp. CICC 10523]
MAFLIAVVGVGISFGQGIVYAEAGGISVPHVSDHFDKPKEGPKPAPQQSINKSEVKAQKPPSSKPGVWDLYGKTADSETYKITKVALGDLWAAKAQTLEEIFNELPSVSGNPLTMSGKLSISSKVYLLASAITRDSLGVKFDNAWLDAWDGLDHAITAGQAVKWSNLAQAARTFTGAGFSGLGGNVKNALGLLSNVEAPSVLGKVGGVVGIGFSAIESGSGFAKAFTAQAGSQDQSDGFWNGIGGLGNMAMAAAPFAAACPPLAVGMAVGGGIVWGASTILKHTDVGKKIAKSAVGAVKSVAKKLWPF